MSRNWTPAALFLLALAGPGCVDQDRQIAALRKELTDAKASNDRLAQQLNHANQRIDQLTGQVASLNKMPADRWEMIPRPTAMDIDGASGLRAGRVQTHNAPTTQPIAGAINQFARLYLVVRDQDNFPMRAVGPMKISLFDLSTIPPRVLGDYSFTPRDVAGHYRFAMTNEIFTFDLPLNAEPREARVTVRVEFTDLLTGKTFVAEKSLTLLK